ncbi:hypothetical protein [Rhodoferax antarcticus]|uniref:Uncharacterized protein n=1 Tax=Rhodoferax antarcticus ANT.BR TaxID=1111071 RepID=A0A1Q8Y8U3_9BURK|nr:hypothetical protein [Rhodoferax antarcticus]OLP04472.1 hypothetical protein BLL52_4120 [Rhodoferax antarcticus ANT.BR]
MTTNFPGEPPSSVALVQAERDAFKWAYGYLQDRMRSIARFGWAQDCDSEIEARIQQATAPAKAATMTFKTTLFQALSSAGTVFCDGYQVTTQIDGALLGKSNQVMLECDDELTVIFSDQDIEIDEVGENLPKVVVSFLVTAPLTEGAMLKI